MPRGGGGRRPTPTAPPGREYSTPVSDREHWAAIDRYIVGQLLEPDPALDEVLAANAAGGLPPIDVSPNQGQLLALFARMLGARSVLEVGTLGGYSTIWLARALSPRRAGGDAEVDPHHAQVARANLARAGLADRVELRLGPAAESLDALVAAGGGPSTWCSSTPTSPATRPTSLGPSSCPGPAPPSWSTTWCGVATCSTRQRRRRRERHPATYEWLAAEPRVRATAIQTVGSKGHDGFVLALVS